jgi:hypothetical protein
VGDGVRAPLFHGVGTVSGRAGGLCAVYIESISPIKYIITAGRLLQNCATDTRSKRRRRPLVFRRVHSLSYQMVRSQF